ncbi:hypothetical protein ABH935_008656 [Catenulispora sp. GAS73]|uniref:hypothetical protein n=1 Tax=Catenulispora sp. GAS73 TaxID=3156269 RepID=UPI0035131EB1
MDQIVTKWSLSEYGRIPLFRREYDPGTGYAARIAELESDRTRLREDRSAGLYDHADDAKWFREHYARGRRPQTTPSAARSCRTTRFRVVLFPAIGNRQRVCAHGLDPDTATEVRMQAAAAAADSAPSLVAGALSKEWIGHTPGRSPAAHRRRILTER